MLDSSERSERTLYSCQLRFPIYDSRNTSRSSHANDTPDEHYEKSMCSHQGGGNNVAEETGNGVDKGRVVADESDNVDEGQ